MRRNYLQFGDKSSAGGTVIDGMEDCFNENTALTFLGARVVCPACKTTGIIAPKGPRWPNDWMGKEMALEDDLCICKCSPLPVMIASQNAMFDEFQVHELTSMGFGQTGKLLPKASVLREETPASNKQTDQRSTLIDDPALICPNMSNTKFYSLMSRLRDKAVQLLSDRLAELGRWSPEDQIKVQRWFGNARRDTRAVLLDGLTRIRDITRTLTNTNYVRYTDEGVRRVGCVPRSGSDANPATASVCKADGSYTIFIGMKFCELSTENLDKDGIPLDGDSKLLTLIHEVSHFPTAMNAEDKWYVTRWSKMKAKQRDKFCIVNADNIAGYVVNIGD